MVWKDPLRLRVLYHRAKVFRENLGIWALAPSVASKANRLTPYSTVNATSRRSWTIYGVFFSGASHSVSLHCIVQ